MSTQGYGDAASALAKLAIVIRDQREEFLRDPDAVMEQEGINASDIPEPVLRTLTSMAPEELAAVSAWHESSVQAGLVYKETDFGTVCFF